MAGMAMEGIRTALQAARGTILGVAAAVIVLGSALAFRAPDPPHPDWIAQDIGGLHVELLLPAAYRADQRYPLLLYLHQLDMGTDRAGLISQVDGWFAIPSFRASHPAIVVVPMLNQSADKGGRVVNFGGKRQVQFGEAETIAAVHQIMARWPVDPERVYVTGNSMGGMGTWEMLLSYNTRTGTRGRLFAAGLPLAGRHATADPDAAAQLLADVPIWAIHGELDSEVGLEWDRNMARRLSGRPGFRYTEALGLRHDVWDSYYLQPAVWDWLFSQRGVSSTSASASPPAR